MIWVRWTVRFDLTLTGNTSGSGVITLGTLDKPRPLGNVAVTGNVLALNGDIATNGSVDFASNVNSITLAGDTTIDTSAVASSNIDLGPVDGAFDLTLTGNTSGSGVITLGNVGQATALGNVAVSGNVLALNGDITTNGSVDFATNVNSITLAGDTTIDTSAVASSNIDLGPVDGAFDLTLTGNTTGSGVITLGNVGQTTVLGNVAVTGNVLALNGDIATNGSVDFASNINSITLAGDTTIDTSAVASSNIDLGPVDGAFDLTLTGNTTGSGVITLGNVGQATALGNVAVTGNVLALNGDIATNGSVDFASNVNSITLAGDTAIDTSAVASSNIDLGPVDGAFDLTLTGNTSGSGVITLGNVGQTTALGNVAVSGNVLALNSDITTNGSVDFATNVNNITLAGDTTIDTSAVASSNIDLGPVDGAFDLTLTGNTTGSGVITLGNVGQTTALGNVAVTGNVLALNGDIATNGSVDFASNINSITLIGDTVIDTSAVASSNIDLGPVDGAFDLTLTGNTSGSGVITLGNVGQATALGNVAVTGNVLALNGDIATNGSVDFASNINSITLAGDTTIDTSAVASSNIDLGPVDGAFDLTLTGNTSGSGVITLGNVGQTTALGNVAVSGNVLALNSDITTNGSVDFASNINSITLAGDTTIDTSAVASSNIDLGPVDGAFDLTLTGNTSGSGVITLGNVGQATALGNVAVTGNVLALNGDIATNGSVDFASNINSITLAGDTTIDTSAVASSNIDLGPVDGAFDLTLTGNTSGSGVITLGNVGQTTAVGNVAVTGNVLALNGDITTSGAVDLTTVNSTTLAGNTIIDTSAGTNAGITLGPVDSAFDLTLTGDVGVGGSAITLGDIGQTTGLGNVSIAGGNISLSAVNADSLAVTNGDELALNGDIVTSSAIDFATNINSVTLVGNTTIDTSAGTNAGITLDPVDGAFDLTLTGDVGVGGSAITLGDIGQTTGLGNVSIAGGNISLSAVNADSLAVTNGDELALNGDIITSGAVDLTTVNTTTLAGNTTIDTSAGTNAGITLGPVDSAFDLTLTGDVGVGGSAITLGDIGQTTGLGNVSIAGGNISLSAVNADSLAVTNGDELALNGDITTSGAVDLTTVNSTTLAGNTIIDTSAGTNASIALGPVDSAFDLTLTGDVGVGGSAITLGDIGQTTGLGNVSIAGGNISLSAVNADSLTVTNGDELALNGDIVTSSAIDFATNINSVTLVGNTTIDTSAGSNAGITLDPVDGAFDLTLTGDVGVGGSAITLGDIGQTTGLGNVSIAGGNISLSAVNADSLAVTNGDELALNGDITTNGAVDLTTVNSTTLAGNTIIDTSAGTNAGITLGPVDSAFDLTLTGDVGVGGSAITLGDIGQTTGLGNVSIAGGNISLSAVNADSLAVTNGDELALNGDIVTSSAIDFATNINSVTLVGNTTIDTSAGTNAGITLDPVDGAFDLTLTGDVGVGGSAITLGDIGQTTGLGNVSIAGGNISLSAVNADSLAVTNGDELTLNGDITTSGAVDLTTVNTTTLAGNTTIDTSAGTNAGITLGPVDSAFDLTLTGMLELAAARLPWGI